MAQNIKRVEPEEPAGAPEWMVTFSDCMTLLLTFFVLLLSFSSFDDSAFSDVTRAIGLGMPDSASHAGSQNRSLAEVKRVRKVEEIPEGTLHTSRRGSGDRAAPSDGASQKVSVQRERYGRQRACR